jgi:iron complex transport system permease protein
MTLTARIRRLPFWMILVALTVVLAMAAVLGLAVGAIDIPLGRAARVLLFGIVGRASAGTAEPDTDLLIIWAVRAPRVIVGALVGAALAVAGTQMQGLFQNPMASPDVVATSAGAALGAVASIVAGLAQQSLFWLPVCAFGGALASLVTLYALTTRRGRTPVAMLLLAGVAVNSLLVALTSFLVTLHWVRYEVAQEVMFWLLGGLDSRTWTHVWMAAPPIVAALAVSVVLARDLDLFLSGEETAASLGVDIERVKRAVLVTAALLTGTSVAVSGVVGFVGLIVPHAVRLIVGPSHRRVMPAAALVGATFVIASDLVARTVHRPEEIRLGIITGCCGAPFFLWLLGRYRREVSAL